MAYDIYKRLTRADYRVISESIRGTTLSAGMVEEIAAELGLGRAFVGRWFSTGNQRSNLLPLKLAEVLPVHARDELGYELDWRLAFGVMYSGGYKGASYNFPLQERTEDFLTLTGAMNSVVSLLHDPYLECCLRYLKMLRIEGVWRVYWGYNPPPRKDSPKLSEVLARLNANPTEPDTEIVSYERLSHVFRARTQP